MGRAQWVLKPLEALGVVGRVFFSVTVSCNPTRAPTRGLPRATWPRHIRVRHPKTRRSVGHSHSDENHVWHPPGTLLALITHLAVGARVTVVWRVSWGWSVISLHRRESRFWSGATSGPTPRTGRASHDDGLPMSPRSGPRLKELATRKSSSIAWTWILLMRAWRQKGADDVRSSIRMAEWPIGQEARTSRAPTRKWPKGCMATKSRAVVGTLAAPGVLPRSRNRSDTLGSA